MAEKSHMFSTTALVHVQCEYVGVGEAESHQNTCCGWDRQTKKAACQNAVNTAVDVVIILWTVHPCSLKLIFWRPS